MKFKVGFITVSLNVEGLSAWTIWWMSVACVLFNTLFYPIVLILALGMIFKGVELSFTSYLGALILFMFVHEFRKSK